jgi:hypothetical protein
MKNQTIDNLSLSRNLAALCYLGSSIWHLLYGVQCDGYPFFAFSVDFLFALCLFTPFGEAHKGFCKYWLNYFIFFFVLFWKIPTKLGVDKNTKDRTDAMSVSFVFNSFDTPFIDDVPAKCLSKMDDW